MSQQPDTERIQGSWRLVKAMAAGKLTRRSLGTLEIYDGNVFRWVLADGSLESQEFAFRLDPTKNPKHIDLTSDDGTLQGIYNIEDEKLTTCFPENDGDDRPTAFMSSQETGWNLGIAERVIERTAANNNRIHARRRSRP